MDNKNKVERTEISEIGRIATINKLFEGSGYVNESFQHFESENVAFVSKILLEGVDFDLTYTPIKYLGYRAVVNTVGQLYARLYKPTSLSFVIAISSKFSYQHLKSLWEGVLTACKVYSIEKLSLDLTSSLTGLLISCTASGVCEESIKKQTAQVKSGDLICIIGNLGAAYMGLHVLMREKVAFNASKEYKQPDLTKYKYLLSRYLAPEVENDVIERFKECGVYPSEGRFLNRGLGDAIKSLCSEYHLGAKIYMDKIPIATQTSEMAKEIGIDIMTAVINGGDDNRLLFVVPLAEHDKISKQYKDLEVIGHFTSDGATQLVTPEGNSIEIKAQGWD